ncbi:hypothetical protein EMIHUDRAFT_455796 [Emiliania huxleyi CCMP1516]|uniref:Helicase n=2 Tax=Emiliania huxleyi TaxID=2903 RepID=A0A0D3KCL8_EMIH1|nr:hypothetical protein EMIHUDRAFT_455796 [Emiliania huxleyi CCMP1516]EOD33503.1 hypothetical protein EMIHUDRAFT_455796 [Emiliania huxleyi CCMP1516]|eukprot:XP_005785932.1 hypothetical protein EMIHUDRAFT_455796 [Emiliania huxleyi CCMP1516]
MASEDSPAAKRAKTEEGAGSSSPDDGPVVVTKAMEEEEAKMMAESEKEAEKQRLKDMDSKDLRNATTEDKVARLDQLLSKSVAYSEFLANKIKKEGEGADAVVDGSVRGPALPQPKHIVGQMRPYQLVGVHWMVGLYENGLNGILGDEMGLGKTIQSIALLAHLKEKSVAGPFMVVGPLSCLQNWHNEFKKWAPSIPSLVYHGSKEERTQMRGTHYRKGDGSMPVMITSYEIVIRDATALSKIGWKFIIIDEGHRLKNMNCRLIRELKRICGTPLQNNLTELWSLLNFLLPSIFDDLDSVQRRDSGSEGREAKDGRSMECIPSKTEYILYASLSEWQQQQYKEILNKNLSTSDGKAAVTLNNLLMQLRKCCNHPYLFEWPISDAGEEAAGEGPALTPSLSRSGRPVGEEAVDEVLVQASGKMLLLDRLMAKLTKNGHKALLPSLREYCALRSYKCCRLDGGVSAEDRTQAMTEAWWWAMNDFNSDKSIDVFLLSTRAGGLGVNLVSADEVPLFTRVLLWTGGLGVNLVSADTCIIFDSDWNPHMDLQAQDRCHRIGQTKRVMVYRLAACGTVEEQILVKAKQKLKLEQLVVSKGKFKDIGKKTDRSERIAEDELQEQSLAFDCLTQAMLELTNLLIALQELLAFDPSKSALGRENKVITDEELAVVLDRSGKVQAGKGFMAVDKTTSAFDAAQRGES